MTEGQWLCERIAGGICTWGEYLFDDDEAHLCVATRHPENTGRPLGDESSVKRIGALPGRDLLAKRPGAERKDKR